MKFVQKCAEPEVPASSHLQLYVFIRSYSVRILMLTTIHNRNCYENSKEKVIIGSLEINPKSIIKPNLLCSLKHYVFDEK